MTRRPRVSMDGLVAAVAAGLAMLLAWWGTRWGAGTSPDSNHYLAAAVSLAESWRLETFTGSPLTAFPPGYPVVVRIAMLPGLSWESASRTICILGAAVLVLTTAALARRVVHSPVLRAAVVAIAVVAPTLTRINRMAWTEPLFVIIVLALVAALIDIDRSGVAPTRRALLLLAALTSAAFLVRYAGLGLVPGVALSLAVIGRHRYAWRSGVVTYVAMCTIVPAVWFTRNLLVSGGIGGPPLPARNSLLTDIRTILEVTGRGVLPRLSPSDTASTVIGVIGAGVIIALVVVAGRRGRGREVLILASSSGFLLLHLLVAARTTWVEFGNRMLSPLLLPVVLIVAISLDRWMSPVTVDDPVGGGAACDRRRQVLGGVAAALAALLLAGWTLDTLDATRAAHRTGVGTADEFWRSPRLANDLATIPADAVVVSNSAGGVWNITGRRPVLSLFDTTRSMTREETCSGAYLVWFVLDRDAPSWVPADATPLIERRSWSINLLSTAGCEDAAG